MYRVVAKFVRCVARKSIPIHVSNLISKFIMIIRYEGFARPGSTVRERGVAKLKIHLERDSRLGRVRIDSDSVFDVSKM